jgi:hypothetical protein
VLLFSRVGDVHGDDLRYLRRYDNAPGVPRNFVIGYSRTRR